MKAPTPKRVVSESEAVNLVGTLHAMSFLQWLKGTLPETSEPDLASLETPPQPEPATPSPVLTPWEALEEAAGGTLETYGRVLLTPEAKPREQRLVERYRTWRSTGVTPGESSFDRILPFLALTILGVALFGPMWSVVTMVLVGITAGVIADAYQNSHPARQEDFTGELVTMEPGVILLDIKDGALRVLRQIANTYDHAIALAGKGTSIEAKALVSPFDDAALDLILWDVYRDVQILKATSTLNSPDPQSLDAAKRASVRLGERYQDAEELVKTVAEAVERAREEEAKAHDDEASADLQAHDKVRQLHEEIRSKHLRLNE